MRRPKPNQPARAAWDRALEARAARDLPAARRWLERTHRLAPQDALVRLTLGALLLELGDPTAAEPHLLAVAQAYDATSAWTALASLHFTTGAEAPCLDALAASLRSGLLTRALESLAHRILARWPRPGWCGLDRDGTIRCAPAAASPGPGDFIGSPLPLERLLCADGLVATTADGIQGWAWCPADPDRDPALLISGPQGTLTLTANVPAEGIEDLPPLARPRRFTVSREHIATLGTPLTVTDALGHALLGSPIGGSHPSAVAGPAAIDLHPRAIDVVIPVHGATLETLACLQTVLATVPPGTVVHVIDDASPQPELAQALDHLRDAGRIRLHRLAITGGFPAAANTGLRAAAGRDVVVLNSDTLVPPGWLDRLRRAAYAAPDIGSATPFSNDGSIVSHPDRDNPVPDLERTIAFDQIAQAANAGQVADIPVGVGFCLFLRRDCLDQVGPLREDVFGQGYGEENDWCLRATHAGWRHVAALDVFVAHVGGRSFGTGRAALRRRNAAVLNRLHPGYDARIREHTAADPLFAARRRMDALRWADGRQSSAVLLVTHADGGGVAEMVAARAESLQRAGQRPIILHPAKAGCAIQGFLNLRYVIPAELPALAELLRPDRPTHMEVHHLLGHRHAVLDLAALLRIPVDTWIHDAAAFCPRINLVGVTSRYCGEPDPSTCEACVAELGSHLRERIGVRALLARSAGELTASRRVVTATTDGARRLQRHFPAIHAEVEPWEDDAALPNRDLPGAGQVRIVVVGAIAVEKGYDVLLDCARDAHARALPLEFTICGFTSDDERLMQVGNVFVTGRYDPAEAVTLIRAQHADLAFVPSVCPESWCYGLSRAWQAGLDAVAFDLGAQAERIRATGRGAVLPLALPIPAVNDALLRLARLLRARQSPQP